MKDIITSNGTGDLHLGWLVPGETACLGVGPVNLRFSKDEAQELSEQLIALLEEPAREPEGPPGYTPCGCPQPRKPAPIQAVPGKFLWGDEG
jgi:hypothetical protein